MEPDTIKLNITWGGNMEILLALLENGTDEGKEYAREELRELARRLDVVLEDTDDAKT